LPQEMLSWHLGGYWPLFSVQILHQQHPGYSEEVLAFELGG